MYGRAGYLWLENSIVAHNSAAETGPDCYGTVTSFGYNLIRNATGCGGLGSSDLVGGIGALPPLDAGLTPLDFSYTTPVHLLNSSSPAIDNGDPNDCEIYGTFILETDQRGFHRPSGGRCDIGAVELQQ